MEREVLEFDALFVGAGPAGLAGAIHLSDLIDSHNRAVAAGAPGKPLGEMTIAVLEKSSTVGAHGISGAVLDPRAMRELLPDFIERGCPAETQVTRDDVYFMWEKSSFRLPLVPPMLQNHGNYVLSLGKLVAWMAGVAEEKGVLVLTETPAASPIVEDGRVLGVRTGDKGVNKQGQRKPNYQPGADCRARVTVLCEGPRGTIAKALEKQLGLTAGRNAQVYSTGVKELWEMPAGRVEKGRVIHTLGFPLPNETFGGGFIYGVDDTHWSVGFVTGLDYRDPTTDPHLNLQRFKTHPLVRSLLEGGKPVAYGAKAIPEGGWWAMPQLAAEGFLLCGDTGGFLNGARLKGVHLAIKSGMLAAETVLDCLLAGDFSKERLGAYQTRVRSSWAADELRRVRNFHQGFEHGLFAGLFHTGIQMMLGGRDLFGDRLGNTPGHERMRKLAEVHPNGKPPAPRFDGTLTFDKLADVYLSGTGHDEDQPVHLVVADTTVCATRCREEYGNPCQHFCPANVYEMVPSDDQGGLRLQINASNCVHCKTCDIADPYQIITWVTPEGGGGPDYKNL
ncbi:MAG: electron transfer flavoprotein-ubiquinone oxidoreductase [Candidatus Eisenbacteria bacterium]|uniref:Electron transfer flavoprotein-ubiquinone oxidoreductase n=1 Tax=Eiseniibacteriota bacterium TaxID=2212470 RepID=A0A538SBI3_UNCEI|nr:MAG: electron transfer flavoprotein-ubiquinone oxidoreductase [Candidatus Eisenbacteria bacterium]